MSNYGKVFDTLKANVDYINSVLPIKDSFDLLQRDIIIGERQSTFFFIDGFTKDDELRFNFKKESVIQSITEAKFSPKLSE